MNKEIRNEAMRLYEKGKYPAIVYLSKQMDISIDLASDQLNTWLYEDYLELKNKAHEMAQMLAATRNFIHTSYPELSEEIKNCIQLNNPMK